MSGCGAWRRWERRPDFLPWVRTTPDAFPSEHARQLGVIRDPRLPHRRGRRSGSGELHEIRPLALFAATDPRLDPPHHPRRVDDPIGCPLAWTPAPSPDRGRGARSSFASHPAPAMGLRPPIPVPSPWVLGWLDRLAIARRPVVRSSFLSLRAVKALQPTPASDTSASCAERVSLAPRHHRRPAGLDHALATKRPVTGRRPHDRVVGVGAWFPSPRAPGVRHHRVAKRRRSAAPPPLGCGPTCGVGHCSPASRPSAGEKVAVTVVRVPRCRRPCVSVSSERATGMCTTGVAAGTVERQIPRPMGGRRDAIGYSPRSVMVRTDCPVARVRRRRDGSQPRASRREQCLPSPSAVGTCVVGA
jgi:hypothetical protein